MRLHLGWTLAVGLIVVAAVGCGDDDEAAMAPGPVGPVELPFGLEQVEGTQPIGRPAVYDNLLYTHNGDPAEGRELTAAYRVTADDPLQVVQAWAEQLDGLTLTEVEIEAYRGGAPDPWVEVSAEGDDWASLELWATEDGPILLVSVDRISKDPPNPTTVVDNTGSVEAPEPTDLGPTGRTAGDELFTEQTHTIHLPEGTTALMPTIPTMAGTGGSTSVLAAENAESAIDALLAEALEYDPNGHVEAPKTTDDHGTQITTASYTRDAGGWSFSILATQHPDDPTATLHITSAAD